MANLHIRSVPEDLVERLQKLALRRSRSMSAQVIAMLSEAAEEEERRLGQVQTLSAIRRRRFSPPAGAPTSSELLREDRER